MITDQIHDDKKLYYFSSLKSRRSSLLRSLWIKTALQKKIKPSSTYLSTGYINILKKNSRANLFESKIWNLLNIRSTGQINTTILCVLNNNFNPRWFLTYNLTYLRSSSFRLDLGPKNGPKLGQKCQKFKNFKKDRNVKCLVFQLII